MWLRQAISEEIGRLQADVKGHDDLKRQMDECMAYQKNLIIEKKLQARHAKVSSFFLSRRLLSHWLSKCSRTTDILTDHE